MATLHRPTAGASPAGGPIVLPLNEGPPGEGGPAAPRTGDPRTAATLPLAGGRLWPEGRRRFLRRLLPRAPLLRRGAAKPGDLPEAGRRHRTRIDRPRRGVL